MKFVSKCNSLIVYFYICMFVWSCHIYILMIYVFSICGICLYAREYIRASCMEHVYVLENIYMLYVWFMSIFSRIYACFMYVTCLYS